LKVKAFSWTVVEFISDGKNFFESGMQEISILWNTKNESLPAARF
jgi:hypothetical protein